MAWMCNNHNFTTNTLKAYLSTQPSCLYGHQDSHSYPQRRQLKAKVCSTNIYARQICMTQWKFTTYSKLLLIHTWYLAQTSLTQRPWCSHKVSLKLFEPSHDCTFVYLRRHWHGSWVLSFISTSGYTKESLRTRRSVSSDSATDHFLSRTKDVWLPP